MKRRLGGCLGVFAIFLCGLVVGLVISVGATQKKIRGLVEGGPDKVVDSIVARLRTELDLDSEQKEMLQQIVVETRIKLAAIRQETQPQVSKTLSEAETKVRGILHPTQVKKFEEIVHRGREKWRTP